MGNGKLRERKRRFGSRENVVGIGSKNVDSDIKNKKKGGGCFGWEGENQNERGGV